MREQTLVLSDGIRKGLRPDDRIGRSTEFLSESFNVKPRLFGLEAFEPITDPFNGGESISFPFPQLFRGKGRTLLAFSTALKSVNESPNPWTASAITTYDAYDLNSTKAIPSGGPWHFADAQGSWFLFNGSCVVFEYNYFDMNSLTNKVLVQNEVTIKTGTYNRGRFILGGFDEGDFWRDEWNTILERWRLTVGEPLGITAGEIGSNWIMWSSIGGGDFPIWLFYPEQAMQGPISPARGDGYEEGITTNLLLERMRRNEFGMMPMPWQGTVLSIKPLGNNLIVYGDEGITALVPVAEPVPTFGMRHIASTGIASRGAVGGDDSGHVFVDSDGSLWTISSDMSIKRMGYREFFYPMLGNDIVISKEPEEYEYYISDGTDSYVLTSSGLGECYQLITSVEFVGGGAVGMFDTVDSGGSPDTSGRIVTDILDFSIRGIKTITSLNLGVSAGVEVALDYRYQSSDSWTRTPFVSTNKEGNAVLRVSALEFRVVIQDDSYLNLDELDYIQVKWQASDKRNIRGGYVSPTNA